MINIGDLLVAIQGVDGADSLGQVDIVGQGAGQVRQQGVKGPESVCRYSVYNPVKVAVSVAVEAYLLGPLLCAQSLQGPGPVQAAVGAVCRTQNPVHLATGPALSLTFVPFVEMLHLHLSGQAHKYCCTICEREKKSFYYWKSKQKQEV